ncbi:PREDICTED: uncharacterized protein LOC104822072 [Tarenaya hassleriana]|uniref:uncharacterized protein LOC104822072 n=1 Tax=Tarenaya hassleriana TaxID=28532 RepID=UPI00053C5D33|nr:PREDICTED: uncharacterized protein LOC104822072 [Tarenaya hassleriana]
MIFGLSSSSSSSAANGNGQVNPKPDRMTLLIWGVASMAALVMVTVGLVKASIPPLPPMIRQVSMDFTVVDVTDDDRIGAKWDVFLRLPPEFDFYVRCTDGEVQASILYRNLTIATSSPQRYVLVAGRERGLAEVVRVSVAAAEQEGGVGKSIMDDIKERGEVRFQTRLLLTDCREDKTGRIRYLCDEAAVVPSPDAPQTLTTLPQDRPQCRDSS